MNTTPALFTVVVLDGYRYEVDEHLEDGTTRLTPADDSHDRVSVVRTADLARESALGVWTIPGRLLSRARPEGGVTTTQTEG